MSDPPGRLSSPDEDSHDQVAPTTVAPATAGHSGSAPIPAQTATRQAIQRTLAACPESATGCPAARGSDECLCEAADADRVT